MIGEPLSFIPDPEDLLAGAFINAPDTPIPFQPRPQPAFLDRLALAFQGLQMQQPQNDVQGFIQGLAGGFGQARGGAFQQQQQDVQMQNRQLAESARLMSQQRWQKYRAQAEQLRVQREAAERQAAAERDARRDRIAEGRLRVTEDQAAETARHNREMETAALARIDAQQNPKPRRALGSEITRLSADANFLKQINKVRALYKPEYVGPVEGRVGPLIVKGLVPGKKPQPGQAAFYAELARTRNEILKARSGGQVTTGEAQRLLDELPVQLLPSGSWEEKMGIFEDDVRSLAETYRGTLQAQNTDLSKTPPLPPRYGFVRMRSPDGEVQEVPAAKVDAFKAKGAVVVP